MNQASVASLRGPLFRPFFLAVAFGVLLTLSQAQTAGTGAISGTINDPSGAVIKSKKRFQSSRTCDWFYDCLA